jgi:magnesium chelatase family protein
LLDRIDIEIEVPAVPYKELRAGEAADSSEGLRVCGARARDMELAPGASASGQSASFLPTVYVSC